MGPEEYARKGLDVVSDIRRFESGAIRNTEADKFDFEGFISPRALECYAKYMHFHRYLSDGSLRDSDNWQKGFPFPVLIKSGWRHFFDWWKWIRGLPVKEGILFALCGVIFNAFATMDQILKENPAKMEEELGANEQDRQNRWKKERKVA